MIQKKICMVGAFGVGKTSLVARFVHGGFSEKYLTTIGVKVDKKLLAVDGEEVMLMLWDLAGEDALTQIKPAHLKGAAGYFVVADGMRAETLDAAQRLQQLAASVVGEAPFLLVVNKADLRDSWAIQQSALDELAARGWHIVLTSAKSGDGVESMFAALAAAMLRGAHARAEASGNS